VNHLMTVVAMIVAALTLFLWNRIPAVIVSIGVSLALLFMDILPVNQAPDGFSDPTLIVIFSLFVVAAGLERSDITIWPGQFIIEKVVARQTRLRSSFLLMAFWRDHRRQWGHRCPVAVSGRMALLGNS
jgi:di/tricarboxylate transporter